MPEKPIEIKTWRNNQPHPDYSGWENFLKTCEVRDKYHGVVYYGLTNCNYVLFPDGTLVQNFGFNGQALMNRIRHAGVKKVLDEVTKFRAEMEDLLKGLDDLKQ